MYIQIEMFADMNQTHEKRKKRKKRKALDTIARKEANELGVSWMSIKRINDSVCLGNKI